MPPLPCRLCADIKPLVARGTEGTEKRRIQATGTVAPFPAGGTGRAAARWIAGVWRWRCFLRQGMAMAELLVVAHQFAGKLVVRVVKGAFDVVQQHRVQTA